MRALLPAVLLLASCGAETHADGGTDLDGPAPPCASVPRADAVPIGWDAIRRWDEWPRLRLGVRTVMRSTHDPSGGNEAVDASHFLRRDAAGLSVPLDLAGPGVLYFVRHNHWHGSPWHYQVDGNETVVSETSTATVMSVPGAIWEPHDVFPSPLARTWDDTKGADLSWVPVPFEERFTLGYERTHYGTGYFIAQLFPDGAPITTWDVSPPPADVLALAGSDAEMLAPTTGLTTTSGAVDVPASGAVTIADVAGPRTVRSLVIEAPTASAPALATARIRITWDSRAAPSVDAPLVLFFGAGSLADPDGREWLVRAFATTVHVLPDRVRFTMVFPMPFRTRALVELVGTGAAAPAITYAIGTAPDDAPTGSEGLFHATYVDHGVPTPGEDLVLLDTRGAESAPDWCGSFVGTSVVFSDRGDAGAYTLEGDPRFFFDDAESPQAQGTGTEEWGGGGDYWGGLNMTLPFAGHPVGSGAPGDEVESLYRFLLADLFPFGRRARIQLEHGGVDESTEHYRSVVYWYGLDAPCLVKTDSMQVGDTASESAHGFDWPGASDASSVTTRWDLGPDVAPDGHTVHEATSDTERHGLGASELTLAIDPNNVGVTLRRKLDARFRDQRADVYVADVDCGIPGAFEPAGVWFLAGGSTVVFSAPPGERDPPQTIVESPDRRWREDELVLPARLTSGRSAIRVRIVPRPTHVPLTPETPLDEEAWSAVRYDAYAWVRP